MLIQRVTNNHTNTRKLRSLVFQGSKQIKTKRMNKPTKSKVQTIRLQNLPPPGMNKADPDSTKETSPIEMIQTKRVLPKISYNEVLSDATKMN